MTGRRDRLALVLTVACCCACYSPATHAGARTAPAGQTETFGGVDVLLLRVPSLVVGLRHGLHPRADFGLRVAPDLRADVKLQAVRSRLVGLSFAPAVWLSYLHYLATVQDSAVPPVGASVTMLIDLHVADAVAIGPHGGVGYTIFRTLPVATDETPRTEHGPMVHGGLGLSIALSDDLILRPEGTIWWYSPRRGPDEIRATAGIVVARGAPGPREPE